MSNFSIFNSDHLAKLLDPFAPGMAPHIIPIKYEALTPDLFVLLFRTTGQDGQNHFFVSLEFDHMDSIDGARCTVEDWHGSFTRFWPLASAGGDIDDSIEALQAPTEGPYFAILAEVLQPTSKGYWSDAVTIRPGDTIGDKISHFNKQDQENVYTFLQNTLKHTTDPSMSFIESLQKSKKDIIVNDTNMTNMAVSIYKQPDGQIEYFYNYVRTPSK